MVNGKFLTMTPSQRQDFNADLKRVLRQYGITTESAIMEMIDKTEPELQDRIIDKMEEKGLCGGSSIHCACATFDSMKDIEKANKIIAEYHKLYGRDGIRKALQRVASDGQFRRSKSPMINYLQNLYSTYRSGYGQWPTNTTTGSPFSDGNIRDRTNIVRNLSGNSSGAGQTFRRSSNTSIVNQSDRSILFGGGLVGSSTNPAGNRAGQGTYGAVNNQDFELGVLIDSSNLQNNIDKNQFTLTSAIGIVPTTPAAFNSTYVPCWIFTCNRGTTIPTAGATYTNNSVTHTVKYAYDTGSAWMIITTAGTWTASGSTLSKSGGTGDASITFTASTGQSNAVTNTVKNAVLDLSYISCNPSSQTPPPTVSGLGYQALAKTGGTGDAIILYSAFSQIGNLWYQDDQSFNQILVSGGVGSFLVQRSVQNQSGISVTVSETGISYDSFNSGTYDFLYNHDAAPASFTAQVLANQQFFAFIYTFSISM